MNNIAPFPPYEQEGLIVGQTFNGSFRRFCVCQYEDDAAMLVALLNRPASDEARLREAVETVTKAISADPGYRESWKANIAMAFKDEMARDGIDIHGAANRAADNFLNLLCYRAAPSSPSAEPKHCSNLGCPNGCKCGEPAPENECDHPIGGCVRKPAPAKGPGCCHAGLMEAAYRWRMAEPGARSAEANELTKAVDALVPSPVFIDRYESRLSAPSDEMLDPDSPSAEPCRDFSKSGGDNCTKCAPAKEEGKR